MGNLRADITTNYRNKKDYIRKLWTTIYNKKLDSLDEMGKLLEMYKLQHWCVNKQKIWMQICNK